MFNNIYSVAIILVIVISIIYFYYPIEKFSHINPYLTGYQPYGSCKYYIKQRKYYKQPKNIAKIYQHMWETKLPLVCRYSYDDKPCVSHMDYLSYGPAKLKELPLNLKNIWNAIIDPSMFDTDYHLLDY